MQSGGRKKEIRSVLPNKFIQHEACKLCLFLDDPNLIAETLIIFRIKQRLIS